MTAPSNANTSGLEVVAWRFKFAASNSWSYHPSPPDAEWADDCRELTALVTAASAQARIAELEADLEEADMAFKAWAVKGAAAEARADRLAKALETLQDLFAREGECSMERFERIAEMFRKDTGYLAPGKDPGMLSQQPEGDELRRIYDDWYAGKIKTARAALQQETQP